MADGIRVLYAGGKPDARGIASGLEAADGSLRVAAAASAAAALDALAGGDFDCVVGGDDLDASPLALFERVRERHPGLPFVLFPADGDEALAGAAADAGVDAYLPHADDPERYAALADRIRRLVAVPRGADGGDASDLDTDVRGEIPYERLLETCPVGIVVLNADGRIGHVNASAEEIFESSRSEMVGRTFDELEWRIVDWNGDPIPEDDRPLERAVGTGEIVTDYEHGIERPSGERRWLSVNAAPLGSADGEIEYVVAAAADATERRERERALAALHDTTRQFVHADSEVAVCELAVEAAREILDLPINGVWLYDEDENEGILRPVARTNEADALLDQPTYTGGDSLSWEVFERGEFRVYEDLSAVDGQYNPDSPLESEIVLPLGDHGVMNIGATEPNAFGEGDVALARLLAANAEAALERTAQEAERRARASDLERQNERLEEFASVISHDLRNPLGVARARLELLSTECDSDHVDPLARSLDRMDAIVEDVLTLARQGELVGETEPIDLAAAAEGAWGTVETEDADLVLEGSTRIDADPSRLQELLENLFRNAVEHGSTASRTTSGDSPEDGVAESGAADPGPDGGEGVTIRVGSLSDGDGFYVGDDGPGVPPEERDRIFEHGYSTADDGTGFGLAIVDEIARAHGWSIRTTESAADGARFEIATDSGD